MNKPIRPIRIEGDIAYVPLTRGYEALVDAADVGLVAGFNWYAFKSRNTTYAARKDYSSGKQRTVLMHRAIMGDPNGLEVDHEDGSGLNNRRNNLREATSSQNKHNARKRSDNTSGFKGVTWRKDRGKWRALIVLGGKQKYLGYYDTPEQAHAAYCKASADLHKDFGRTA